MQHSTTSGTWNLRKYYRERGNPKGILLRVIYLYIFDDHYRQYQSGMEAYYSRSAYIT